MIQIAPQMRLLVAIEPVDFRKGIDGLAGVCGTYGVPLIDKRDIDIQLGPAVRQALGLPADVEA